MIYSSTHPRLRTRKRQTNESNTNASIFHLAISLALLASDASQSGRHEIPFQTNKQK